MSAVLSEVRLAKTGIRTLDPVIGRLQVSDAGHCWIVEFEASFWVYSKLLPTISRAGTH